MIESVFQDLRIALRTWSKNVAFTLVAIVTLALGIGANTAIFSVVNAVLLRPLPYKDSSQIVWIWSVNPKGALKQRVSYPDFLDWREQTQTLECCAGINGYQPILTGSGPPQRLHGALTMGNLFTLLGVPPMLGTISETDKTRPDAPGAVLSHRLWQRTFNSDANVVGRRITLDGLTCTVTGVMPAGFEFPIQTLNSVEIWVRVERFNPALEKRRDARLIETMGRLQPGITLEQAQAEMDVIASNLSSQYPASNDGFRVRVVPAIEEVTQGVSLVLLTLFGGVACLLLIACVNIANLQLARAVRRRHEIAVRAVIGASRARIGQQLVIESLMIGIAGGIIGGILAFWVMDILTALLPADIPRVSEIAVDVRVLGFTMLSCLAASLMFGLAPAWFASRIDLTVPLHETTHVTGRRSGRRLSSALVVGEIALAMILLTGAGLFLKSLWRLNQIEPGFDPKNVLTFGLSLPSKYARPHDAFEEIQARLQAIPGVVAASTGLQLPDRGRPILNDASPFFEIEGRPALPGDRPRASILTIQRDYFRALGIPLRGRDFSDRDRAGAPRVIIVNQSLARRYFPNEDPVGKRLRLESWVLPGQPMPEIVGVASDVKHAGLAAAQPLIYAAMAQFPRWGSSIVVKTGDDPLKFAAAVREAIHSFDKDQPVDDFQTLESRVEQSLARDRFSAVLLGMFSVLALALAAVGLYGVLSYVTAQRRQEIGIRIALGAQIRGVLKLVLSQGMTLVFIGIAMGLAGAVALTRLLESLLFGVSATDPFTFALVALLLLLVGGLASWIPARRAAKVDPMTALRSSR